MQTSIDKLANTKHQKDSSLTKRYNILYFLGNRDHGIPGYNKVREKCGLSSIVSLDQRAPEINEVNHKSKLYPLDIV